MAGETGHSVSAGVARPARDRPALDDTSPKEHVLHGVGGEYQPPVDDQPGLSAGEQRAGNPLLHERDTRGVARLGAAAGQLNACYAGVIHISLWANTSPLSETMSTIAQGARSVNPTIDGNAH